MSITLCIGVSEMLLWLSWNKIVSMAVMEQDRFWFRGMEVFGVVVECSAGDVWGGRAEGFFGCLALDGGGVVPGRVPDVPGRVGGRARTAAGKQG